MVGADTDVGAEIAGMVKTNTKILCKDTIENMTKKCPGGSCLVLKINSTVPRDRPLNAIVYKDTSWKVLYLIASDDTGSRKYGVLYSSNYPDRFSNFSICPLSCTLGVSKLFGSFNLVESHNKSKQSDLVLEKYWVTQCGWLRLCTTVAMGMNIHN